MFTPMLLAWGCVYGIRSDGVLLALDLPLYSRVLAVYSLIIFLRVYHLCLASSGRLQCLHLSSSCLLLTLLTFAADQLRSKNVAVRRFSGIQTVYI